MSLVGPLSVISYDIATIVMMWNNEKGLEPSPSGADPDPSHGGRSQFEVSTNLTVLLPF